MRLIMYPGAHPDFNVPGLAGKPKTYFGHHLEYNNEAAGKATLREMTRFLKETLER